MAVKLFGAVLIIISGAVCGFLRSQIPCRRYKSLRAVYTCLEILENEIDFSLDSIGRIFMRISKLCEMDYLFKTAAEFSGEISVGERWKRAVDKDSEAMCLKKEDCETIKLLSQELGTCGREEQIKNIRHVKALLDKQIITAEEDYKKSAKLYKSLGVAGGIFIAILLF